MIAVGIKLNDFSSVTKQTFSITSLLHVQFFLSPIEWLEYNNFFVERIITFPNPTMLCAKKDIDIYLKCINLPSFCLFIIKNHNRNNIYDQSLKNINHTTITIFGIEIVKNYIAYINNYAYILWRKRIRLTRFAVFRQFK